jgi:hypothetical protein
MKISWASAGEGKGGLLPPPWPAKNSMFLDFFGKNSIFFVVFKAKSRFLPPPWKFFALPWKKVCGRPWKIFLWVKDYFYSVNFVALRPSLQPLLYNIFILKSLGKVHRILLVVHYFVFQN